MAFDQRLSGLAALGITLPEPPRPLGEYVAIKQIGRLVFMSGMLPLQNGKPSYTGALSREQAHEAARLATINALAVLKAHLGTLDRVRQVVRVAAYIACPPEFQDHAFVADGDLGFKVLDVSDPANPKLTARLWLGGVLGNESDAGRPLTGGPQICRAQAL